MISEVVFWLYTIAIYGIGLLIGLAWGRSVVSKWKGEKHEHIQ